MDALYLALALFAGVVLLLNAFSRWLHLAGLPGPTLALLVGVLLGPHALGVFDLRDFTAEPHRFLEEVARITLGVGLVGVALRLPHGYWLRNRRWILASIGVGMVIMLATSAAILWLALGLPLLVALVIAAVITPTDPIVTTPIVTGSAAEERVPARLRFNMSAESGLNDGLGLIFVLLPVLLLTKPAGAAWMELLTRVVLWEVLGGILIGAVLGYAAGVLFDFSFRRGLMEETSSLGFVLALALCVLGAAELANLDAVLVVFVAAAVFGQVVPRSEAEREDRVDDTVNRFVALPAFVLLGIGLPLEAWVAEGLWAVVVVVIAIVARRLVAVWATRPIFAPLHSRAETMFLSWFGPIGISALFYATLAERHTGDARIFTYATMAITASVLLHGATTVPWSRWLQRRTSGSHAESDNVFGR